MGLKKPREPALSYRPRRLTPLDRPKPPPDHADAKEDALSVQTSCHLCHVVSNVSGNALPLGPLQHQRLDVDEGVGGTISPAPLGGGMQKLPTTQVNEGSC